MHVVLPRILSVATPLIAYVLLFVLVYGVARLRTKLEWKAGVSTLIGFCAALIFLSDRHTLYYDEDIYIHIASNLSHAPVAQLTLLGGPGNPEVATYYKEPVGFPSFLSVVFLATGTDEHVAFIAACVCYALAMGTIYQVSRALNQTSRQAALAALLFGATPIVFVHARSVGTDIPAALFAALGFWGIVEGNGALAAAGIALAAQTRLEMIVLAPLLFLSGKVSARWKTAGAFLLAAEVVHVSWLLSVAPVLARLERIESTFSPAYVVANVMANVRYLTNPLIFPAIATLIMIGALFHFRAEQRLFLAAWLMLPFSIYAVFYAGSFQENPRYCIQLMAPLALLGVSAARRPWIQLLIITSVACAYMRPIQTPVFLQTLAADHKLFVRFVTSIDPGDLVLSTEPEVVFNYGHNAMNAVYAAQRPDRLNEQFAKHKVWYWSGGRANVKGSPEYEIDQWVKSRFDLRLVESHTINGMQLAGYAILPKPGR
jgi:hypothetical protein